ncbi:MAG: TIGR00268 family protein [candidate division Zixibacteria bacterium HGW-Zixibacteria-1]|nr:MAG: TIGR00268 family protein [candidate division Zixibacteria bacterium HGW-Zixibacteria-1]
MQSIKQYQEKANHPKGLAAKVQKLMKQLASLDSALIAYSGGVDSTFLLKIGADVLKDKLTAVTSHSEVTPPGDFEQASAFAESLGVKYIVIKTDELADAEFTANPIDRCYHCKHKLFEKLSEIAREHKIKWLLDGANFDDLSDYRPGARAAGEFGVISPLKEAGLTKDEIRILSKELNLPTWDKPASPCLASRVPYGQVITPEKLSRIGQSEEYLRTLGVRELRVRDHDDVARIEIPPESINLFLDESIREKIIDKLKSFGYKYVALDLQGFRSGSLNEVLKNRSTRQE